MNKVIKIFIVLIISINLLVLTSCGYKEVAFEEGSQLATIGEDAFYGCACSNSIEFPNGLKG